MIGNVYSNFRTILEEIKIIPNFKSVNCNLVYILFSFFFLENFFSLYLEIHMWVVDWLCAILKKN